MISHDRLSEEDVVKMLSSRLSSCKGKERAIIVQTLRHLILQNDQYKENMKDLAFLSAVVKSLTRDEEEQREAVGLLLNLSDDAVVRRRMGRVQGCIVMLVAISNGDDPDASHDARMLLNVMSGNTQHVLHMAEAGYFKPLVKYLKEGSEMSKVLMATALSRLELTDQNKASLGEDGAIGPLVKMFNTGNLEAKLSALNALQSLSTLKQNIQRLIDSGIVVALLQLLFSVTSVLMTLREPASAILAKVAQSESIFVKQDVAHQMLSLLNLSSPVIQNHLLEALNNIVTHVAALGILSNLPVSDGKVTYILKNANLLPLMISILNLSTENSNSTPTTVWLAESIAAILVRFTVPTDKRLQHYSVENGVIPVLLKLLSRSSETAKRYSALCLTQLSQNSLSLSKSRKLKWFCMPPSVDAFCSVHDGYCSVKNTFCLVKAGAVIPLIRILEGTERGADEAVLSCLSTLLQDEIWENGCNFLARTSAVHAVIRVLTHGSLKSREKALWILERVFRVEAHREQYGESAQVLLIDLAQNGDPMLAPSVAKLLAQLELLQDQSSYF
ncbi:U-box domain-containing protein 43 [Sesamum angolense]|uniref:U-box domain-containing protein 43 n=1 Tax=Sesamum angolense TaxID=2727404 RepID=A0AAE1X6Q7_9LAMI|nr:U-box domain-containing protein 43 [Sesamum angolense]